MPISECAGERDPTADLDHRWGVILAGGDGKRLLPLTRRIAGDDRPKQFCSVFGNETLLDQTRKRVAGILPSYMAWRDSSDQWKTGLASIITQQDQLAETLFRRLGR